MSREPLIESPRVLIIGAGAIGGFYGALLARAGAKVSVVLRSDVETVRAQGFSITSPLGDLSFRPERVYAGGDTPGPDAHFDWVICCVKVLAGLDRAALITPWLSAQSRIVLIENGMDIEAPIAEALPDHALVSGLAFVAVSRTGPGTIEHKAFGHLTFGAWPQGISDDCKALERWFTAAGVQVKLVEQVVAARWAKSVWNAPFNPLSVLAGGADTLSMLDTPGGEALVRALMAEVVAIAAAHGHPLPDDAIDRNIAGTRSMPAYRNSMALDYLAGRPLEIDAILGHVLAIARRSGVAAPRLETLYVSLAIRARMAERDMF